MNERFTSPVASSLRDYAVSLPEVSEGTSCVNRAFEVRGKSFLFVGEKDDGSCKVMMKLGPSLDGAASLADSDSRFEVGKFGWTTVRFGTSDPPDADLVRCWVAESYRLIAPKGLAARV